MTAHTLAQKIAMLQDIGLQCGERDPRRNTGFDGRFMVAEPLPAGVRSTTDAAGGGYAIVGNDLSELVNEAFEHFAEAISKGSSCTEAARELLAEHTVA